VVTPLLAPAHAVDRPALRRRLDEALVQPLTLIVAPAGAGKTVLLAQWAATHPELDFVWVEVGADDNDPVRFSQRLLQGFTAINPDFADLTSLVSLHGGGLGAPLLEAFEAQMAELPEVIIVLDDLHHLSNSVLLGDLGGLVDRLPPNVHMVLSTRTDLPIAWSRHRLAPQMTEIRQSDLALDDAAGALLLEQITGRSLGPDSVSTLVVRTEGWAAGLQLAGMTLRLYEDSDEFITQFSGDDRLIADYLSQVVLHAQPDDRREVLLQISVLDLMCAELVAHLSGVANGQLVLEELERQSMFLFPLDTRRQWFRFHHLFRDMLRFKLRAEQPGAEARLLDAAASWHLARGEVSPGVECLLRAQNWDAALEVIMGRGSEVFERGEMATVIRWISEVPELARRNRRDVSLLLGFLKGVEGQAASAEDILGRVAADPEASEGERVSAQVFLAAEVQWRPRPDVSRDMAIRALGQLADIGDAQMPAIMNLTHRVSLETMTLLSGGRAYFQAGEYVPAREWLNRGLASPGATYPIWKVSGLGSLALLEAWCGHTERAAALAEEALAVAKEVGLLAHPSPADAYLASALVAVETGAPRQAALSLHEGSLRAEANRRSQLSWIAHFEKALLQEADGQRERAMATSLLTRSDLGAPPPPIVASRLLALHCRLLRLGGSPEQAQHALDRAMWYPATSALAFERVATALTLGDHRLARKLMDDFQLLPDAGEPLGMVNGLLLRAWSADVEGSAEESKGHLASALAVAEPHSLVESFVRAGPAIIRMVSKSTDMPSPLRDQILSRAREVALPAPGADLVDPLTDRELEILSYLPSRFTNTELADHFYVSVNTIKTHMAHIYRKLDVANRNGAIARARQLGILRNT
jgi:LuxR family transcriptional regulator, maltose regulon positive regulatory protein